jgi:hypothetical protein
MGTAMDKRRIEALEKHITANRNDIPSPGFFSKHPNVEIEIEQWRSDLLKQGYTLEQVNLTPAYIEE